MIRRIIYEKNVTKTYDPCPPDAMAAAMDDKPLSL